MRTGADRSNPPHSAHLRAILMAVVVLASLLAAGAWFLHNALRKPLGAIAIAMDQVANADYQSAIPLISRKDEAGRLAQSLDVMRHGLGLAEAERRKREAEVARQESVVRRLSDALQTLADGDLTARLPADFPEDYRQLRENFDTAVEHLGTAMRAVVGTAARGVGLVGAAGQTLSNIAGRVQHISGLVSGIAQGAGAQSGSLNEINLGVAQLDQVTQQNAAMVQEATHASESLQVQAQNLVGLVAVFKIDVGPAVADGRRLYG